MDLLRAHLPNLSVPLEIGAVRADVHELLDGPAALVDRHVLEQLAHLEEDHDEHGLGVLPDRERADGGKRHEEILLEQLAVKNLFDGLPHDIVTRDGIRDEEAHEPHPARRRPQPGCQQQYGAQNNAAQPDLLFLFHRSLLQMLFRHADDRLDVVVGERIVDGFAVAAVADELRLAEDLELIGHGGLAEAQQLREIADTELGLEERVENLDAGGVAEYLEQLGHRGQLVLARRAAGDERHRVGVHNVVLAALVLIAVQHWGTSFHINTCLFVYVFILLADMPAVKSPRAFISRRKDSADTRSPPPPFFRRARSAGRRC